MRYAMDDGYDLLLNLDADFSHPPRYLPWLLAGMRDHDVMIGSRYVAGGGTANWPLSRRLISRSVNLFVRLSLRMGVRDASGALSLLPGGTAPQGRPRGRAVARLLVPAGSAVPLPPGRGHGSANSRSSSRTARPGRRRSTCANRCGA